MLKFKPLDDFFPFQNVIANRSVFAATSVCVCAGADPGFDEGGGGGGGGWERGGSDKRPPKAVALMASKMRFPAFSGAI